MSSDTRNDTLDNDHDLGLKQKSPTSNQAQARAQISVHQRSGMTPSIITTINNADPNHPPANYPSIVSNNNLNGRNRRNNDQYESYIEDSFVGHWEHEDDDVDEYQEDFDHESPTRGHDDNSNLEHPSTIEFDFDSFGPESFIYTPAPAKTTDSTTTTTITTDETLCNDKQARSITTPDSLLSNALSRPPTLVEVSSESEKQEEDDHIRAAALGCRSGSTTSEQSQPDTVIHHKTYISQGKSVQYRNLKPQYDIIDPTQIDLKVIEPYKKVISHAGYCHHYDPNAPTPDPNELGSAVIVFSACYLPDRSRRDYNYVMDHLFLYVLTSLHELIDDDYILIYLHNTRPGGQNRHNTESKFLTSSNNVASTSSAQATTTYGSEETQHHNNLPTFSWMKRCYQMIDRRLRKNLRILYLVKPTFWLKTVVIMCKPFISAKFSKKLRFIEDMDALRKCLPVDKLIMPASADHI